MRALLVQLPIPPPGPHPIQGNVPLAAGYLKLFAQRSGVQGWAITDITAREAHNVLSDQSLVAGDPRRRLNAGQWSSCYLWNIQRTIWIARQLKAARPDLTLLLGGPEITADNRWVLEEPCVDLAAIGEGEQTFVELLTTLHAGAALSGIAGLWTRGGDLPAPRAALTNLDLISSPYIEGILDATEEQTMLMETSRGCRYRCKFCYLSGGAAVPCPAGPAAGEISRQEICGMPASMTSRRVHRPRYSSTSSDPDTAATCSCSRRAVLIVSSPTRGGLR